jgi:carbonic anhydrase
MKETVKKLVYANHKYVTTGKLTGKVSARIRQENADGQKPWAVIITCSDSRVIPEAVFSAGLGELFVVRTAGNVIGEAELGSVEYAVDHLHVDTVIVMGHTGCGAVNAALHGEYAGAVGVITRRIKEAVGEESDPYRACRLNVLSGVSTLKKELNGKVTVKGAIYDIVSGQVAFLD